MSANTVTVNAQVKAGQKLTQGAAREAWANLIARPAAQFLPQIMFIVNILGLHHLVSVTLSNLVALP